MIRTLWVKWFGENQVSEVCRVKIVNLLAYQILYHYIVYTEEYNYDF